MNQKKLRALGLKVTPQRLAILDILEGNRLHPSAEKIYRRIVGKYPGVSLATVYNTLSKLVEAGEIRELDIDPRKKRFDPDTSLHHHFFCRTCGAVYDVDPNIPFRADLKKIEGHQVEETQVNFKGLCKACSKR
jgi:Fur family peroxide stress response transcriptional regulator